MQNMVCCRYAFASNRSGCYTLVGPQISASGQIVNPTRVDWQSYSALINSPGYWHAHYNESDKEAHSIPLQDAGLQTYLRSLDIKFVLPDGSVSW